MDGGSESHGPIAAGSGQAEKASNELIESVYGQLRALAQEHLARERPGHTLEATALVNEAYLRLASQRTPWRSRAHFFAMAATMIRRILVDHARARAAGKRGGGGAGEEGREWQRLTLSAVADWPANHGIDVLALDDALERLAALNERQARVVELRFFGGLTIEQTAAALEVSTTTVEEAWAIARAWLRRALEDGARDRA